MKKKKTYDYAIKTAYLLLLLLYPAALSAQNIGIGEANPVEGKLQVKAADSAVLLLQNSAAAGVDIKTALYFKTGNSYSGSIATIGNAATHRFGIFTFGGSSSTALKERLSVTDDGRVGINNIAPAAQLDVQGTVKIVNGSQGNGKVLTSDAAGNASWQKPPSLNTGFKVFSLANSPGPDVTLPIPFSTQAMLDGKFDDGNNFDNTLRAFVAPADGMYIFNVTRESNGLATTSVAAITMSAIGTGSTSVANLPRYKTYLQAGDAVPASVGLHFMTRMQAGDAIRIDFTHNLPFNFPGTRAMFEGVRIY